MKTCKTVVESRGRVVGSCSFTRKDWVDDSEEALSWKSRTIKASSMKPEAEGKLEDT